MTETTSVVPDLKPLLDALKGAITPEQLLAIIASIVGVGIGFVLMWFGVRKAVNAFTSAVFAGRIRV